MPGRQARHRRFLRNWLPLLLCCAALLWQSSFPSLVGENRFPLQDKLEHIIVFCFLAWLFTRALIRENPGLATPVLILTAVLFTGLLGLSDEILQSFVPARQASFGDFGADVLGSLLGALGYLGVWPGRT